MSVVVRMEMPGCCWDCPCLDDCGDYPRCRISNEQRGYNFPIHEKRMPRCPITQPLPEGHGRLVDADAYSAEMKDRQEAAWKWRNEAIADEDEVKLARAEGAFTAFTEAKLTMDKHIINPWHRVEDELPDLLQFVVVCNDEGKCVVAQYVGYQTDSLTSWRIAYTMYDTDIYDETECGPVRYWMPIEPPKEDA